MNDNSCVTEIEIRDVVLQVIHKASTYDIEALETLYAPDQSILFITRDGAVDRSPRKRVIAEFAERRDSGEPPLLTEHRILYIDQQQDSAVALLYRRMSDSASPFLYELRLRRDAGTWRVSGETVTPWPDVADAGAFLPTRQGTAIVRSL
jgi:hypothetical protein